MSWMLLTRTICCTSRIAGIHSEKMNFLKIEKWWQYIFTVLGKRRVESVFSVVSKSLAKLGPWHSYHLRIGSIGCVETRWPVISWLFFGWRWWYWWWGRRDLSLMTMMVGWVRLRTTWSRTSGAGWPHFSGLENSKFGCKNISRNDNF